MAAEFVAETSRCHRVQGSRQYGLRNVNGVPVWNGDIFDFETMKKGSAVVEGWSETW